MLYIYTFQHAATVICQVVSFFAAPHDYLSQSEGVGNATVLCINFVKRTCLVLSLSILTHTQMHRVTVLVSCFSLLVNV
jgi:hypothetical protein